MRSLVLALAAAGMLTVAAPAVSSQATAAQATAQATDFSSRTKVVIRDGWRHRHRHHNCRTIVVKRWHHGHRVVKRTRVCR
jgi:Ni/Co efflux regulator RcnB